MHVYLLIFVLLIIWWVYANDTKRIKYIPREGLTSIPDDFYKLTNPKQIDDLYDDYVIHDTNNTNNTNNTNKKTIDPIYSSLNNAESVENLIDKAFPFNNLKNINNEAITDFNGTIQASFNKDEGMVADMHVKNPARVISNPSSLMTRMSLDGYSNRKTM